MDGVAAVSEVYQPMFNCGKDIVSIKFAMTRHSDPRLIIRKYHNLTVSCSHLISAFSLFGNTLLESLIHINIFNDLANATQHDFTELSLLNIITTNPGLAKFQNYW